MDDRVQRLGSAAVNGLRRLVRELLARKDGGHLVDATLQEVSVEIAIPLQDGEGAPAPVSEALVASIDRYLDEAIRQAVAFRPGRAFCHRCAGSGCEHSIPPSSRHVLVGYGPTGTPRWDDFSQMCLDARHPEVDLLYEDPPAFITMLQDPERLSAPVLDAFENPGYHLVGQLAAGFFPIRARHDEGRGVVALTFQVAGSGPPGGRSRLALNLLGRTPRGEELGMLWERHRELPWRRAVRWAQAALRTVKGPAGGPDDRVRERVDGILRGLARRLERTNRSRARRTRHAEERHEAGTRPTRKAMEDLREARAGAFLVDEREGTVVVLGDRGRTHFFSRDGRLVSSVTYSRDAIGRKIKLGIWREATGEESASLRKRLANGDRAGAG